MPLTRRNTLSGAAGALAAMLAPRNASAVPATTAPPVGAAVAPADYVEGRIKWWNSFRGFGFVVMPGEGRDIFFTRAKFDANGVHRLSISGHRVWVRYAPSPRGLVAEHVRCV
jgi:cold shock protein